MPVVSQVTAFLLSTVGVPAYHSTAVCVLTGALTHLTKQLGKVHVADVSVVSRSIASNPSSKFRPSPRQHPSRATYMNVLAHPACARDISQAESIIVTPPVKSETCCKCSKPWCSASSFNRARALHMLLSCAMPSATRTQHHLGQLVQQSCIAYCSSKVIHYTWCSCTNL